MIQFKDFEFAITYTMAGWIRRIVFREEDSLLWIEDVFDPNDTEFIGRALKPSKFTHLHYLIAQALETYYDYWTGKIEMADELLDLLVKYQISHDTADDFANKNLETPHDEIDSDYSGYLANLVFDEVIPRLVDEIFTVLFSDRELLAELNQVIAEQISNLKVSSNPRLLSKDGTVHRAAYWPSWLERGIYCRDKGHCCACNCDISGLLFAGATIHIDHIVPLHMGGTNDPTNLQILCEKCNLTKGGSSVQTTKRQHMFW